jgi:hypothetical protein
VNRASWSYYDLNASPALVVPVARFASVIQSVSVPLFYSTYRKHKVNEMGVACKTHEITKKFTKNFISKIWRNQGDENLHGNVALKMTGFVDWIHLAQGRDRLRAVFPLFLHFYRHTQLCCINAHHKINTATQPPQNNLKIKVKVLLNSPLYVYL